MHVPRIHGHALLIGGIAAPTGLPHAGDTGQDHAVLAEVVAIAFDFLGDNRTRADEAHVTLDDVPELRQLVKAGLSEERSELCDARVVLELEVLFPFFAGCGIFLEVFLEGFLSVRNHRLELVAREQHAVFTDALMRKNHMAFVVDGHDDSQDDENWRNQDAAANRADEVKDAFDKAVPAAREVVFHREHEDFFAEQDLCLDTGHWRTNKVRHTRDIAHIRLNLLDEMLQSFFLESWSRNDNILNG